MSAPDDEPVNLVAGAEFKCFSYNSLPRLRAELRDLGFVVYELDGGQIRDRRSLDQAFRTSLPSPAWGPPPYRFVWDAFIDKFCDWADEVHETTGAERIAILWLGADRLLGDRLPLLIESICVLTCIFDYLRYRHLRLGPNLAADNPPLTVRAFLIGQGPGFPELPVATEEPEEDTL